MNQHEPEIDKWKTVYKEVRTAFDFRVANLNSQQQRIANVLFANGLIFGFLGASAGIFFDSKIPKWPTSILYVASMCSLALGLVAAVAALWPLIEPLSASQQDQKTKQFSQFLRRLGKILSKPISVPWNKIAPHTGIYPSAVVHYFLTPDEILKDANLSEVELLKKLSYSIVANAAYSNHNATIKFRRGWIRAQLIFIVVGVLLLIPALITRLFTG
jgi:TRAP-type C4-dicarboxylate transport system permease small subunit